MRLPGFSAKLLRPATGEVSDRVTFTELFFDLVFVFAVTQVSHVLIEHHTFAALAHTAILGLIVWWVWVDTVWVTNWLNPELPAVRGMLIGLMLLGLLMASAMPEAFGHKAVLFAVCLCVLQVSRSVFTMLAFARHRPGHAANFLRISIWLSASGAFWIGGAFAADELRPWLWVAALIIDYAGPRARFRVPGLGASDPKTWDVTGEHMAERVSLFIIIALGESIIVAGTTFSGLDIDWVTVAAFSAAFVSTVLLWLLYFSHNQRGGRDYISQADESGLIAQIAYTYVPVPMVFGIVVVAVADNIVLLHPLDGDTWAAALICIGPIVYLLGNAFFVKAIGGPWLLSHFVGILALAVIFVAHDALPSLGTYWLGNGVLAAVLAADEWGLRRRRRDTEADLV
jgi:low temperature requirement protein LtrA